MDEKTVHFFTTSYNEDKNIRGEKQMSSRKNIFISHISEETEMAQLLKSEIEERFRGIFDVFVSSDGKSIQGGDLWFTTIKNAIENADIMLVLCSSKSIYRPWIPFEFGAGLMRGTKTIPICHSDMSPNLLPMPFSAVQSWSISNNKELGNLFEMLSSLVEFNFREEEIFEVTDFLEKVTAIEKRYVFSGQAISAIKELNEINPELAKLFDGSKIGRFNVTLYEFERDEAIPILKRLSEIGIVEFQDISMSAMMINSRGRFFQYDIVINPKIRDLYS